MRGRGKQAGSGRLVSLLAEAGMWYVFGAVGAPRAVRRAVRHHRQTGTSILLPPALGAPRSVLTYSRARSGVALGSAACWALWNTGGEPCGPRHSTARKLPTDGSVCIANGSAGSTLQCSVAPRTGWCYPSCVCTPPNVPS